MGLLLSCLKPRLPVVEEVDVREMLGDWYVIANMPTPFEKGACNPLERYTWDDKKRRIDVDFSFNKDTLDGPVKKIPQKIYTGGFPKSTGRWLASPVAGVKLDYSIMDLAEDYSWVAVGHRSRKWYWLMAKGTTNLPVDVVKKQVALAKQNGFDVSKVVYPKHNGEDATYE
ncbi:Outer membrane lipoprotein Blc [Durusdinium trenchii]|uniref:Outer membrane lipoprotein Blc n=1 Tax=Durusdinium trenchii TaxID=1381693 RepID=A0ABP0JVR7_9DINO